MKTIQEIQASIEAFANDAQTGSIGQFVECSAKLGKLSVNVYQCEDDPDFLVVQVEMCGTYVSEGHLVDKLTGLTDYWLEDRVDTLTGNLHQLIKEEGENALRKKIKEVVNLITPDR